MPGPSCYEFKAENQKSFKYPRGKDYLQPETLRYKHGKLIHIAIEASEDCLLSVSVYQNSLDDLDLMMKEGKKAGIVAKLAQKKAYDPLSPVLSPRADTLNKIDAILGRDSLLQSNPIRETRRIKGKIKKMVKEEENPKDFLELVSKLKAQRQSERQEVVVQDQ